MPSSGIKPVMTNLSDGKIRSYCNFNTVAQKNCCQSVQWALGSKDFGAYPPRPRCCHISSAMRSVGYLRVADDAETISKPRAVTHGYQPVLAIAIGQRFGYAKRRLTNWMRRADRRKTGRTREMFGSGIGDPIVPEKVYSKSSVSK